jgi:hypothetical protein
MSINLFSNLDNVKNHSILPKRGRSYISFDNNNQIFVNEILIDSTTTKIYIKYQDNRDVNRHDLIMPLEYFNEIVTHNGTQMKRFEILQDVKHEPVFLM